MSNGRKWIHFSLGKKHESISANATDSILSQIQSAGFSPPFLCQEGYCKTCIAKLHSGQVRSNSASCLTREEEKDAFILTCQSFMVSEEVSIDYDHKPVVEQKKTSFSQKIAHFFQFKNHKSVWFVLFVGILLSSIPTLWIYVDETHLNLLHPGPMTIGHEKLTCTACHTSAAGNFRQQVQGKVMFWLDQRQTEPDIILNTVTNADCLACHQRPNERHPTYRFNEPRFVDALAVVDARQCQSCHTEHTGKRFSNDTKLCMACHQALVMKKDPLDISHAQLIINKNWNSCLGCHDFHHNHQRKAPVFLSEKISHERLMLYLNHGPDPYSPKKSYPAKEVRE